MSICLDDWERYGYGNEKLWPGSSEVEGGLVCSAYMSEICWAWTGTSGSNPKLVCKPFAEWPTNGHGMRLNSLKSIDYPAMFAAKKKYEEEQKQGKKQESQTTPKPQASNNQKGSGKECARLCWDGHYSGCNKVVKDGERNSWAGSWNDQVSSLKVTKGCRLTA